MNGVEALKTALKFTESWLPAHLSGFTDAELFVRPTPTSNHTAWQLGHLIVAERYQILAHFPEAAMPALPEGFIEAHKSDRAANDGPEGFWTLGEYLALYTATRQAAIAALDGITDADLDRPTPGRLGSYAPTLATVLALVASHPTMHCGQITCVRRALGKPVLF